jgi:transposase
LVTQNCKCYVLDTCEQTIFELEAYIKILEKKKARVEHLDNRADKKVIIFDMLIDMAEKRI